MQEWRPKVERKRPGIQGRSPQTSPFQESGWLTWTKHPFNLLSIDSSASNKVLRHVANWLHKVLQPKNV